MEKCHRKREITFRQSGGTNYRKEKKCFMNLIWKFHEPFLRGKIKSYVNLRGFFIVKTEEIQKYTRKTLINHV